MQRKVLFEDLINQEENQKNGLYFFSEADISVKIFN